MRFKRFFAIFLCFILFSINNPMITDASDSFSFILLTKYTMTLNIGEEAYLLALTSTGKSPTFKSSDTKIASVNTYGKITAKKAGTTLITAKIKNAESSCIVTVNKTKVTINKARLSLERGAKERLSASVSTDAKVTWKSSKKSVATISETGLVTTLKPGETTITASADGTSTTSIVTVKSPTITLSQTHGNLYRKQSLQLTATVSSNITPQWKSNKSSVATVDKQGKVTAIKHGTAIITATVDGVSSSCEIIVDQPEIILTPLTFNLKVGETTYIKATISSGNSPIWSTSNPNVATVDKNGKVKGIQKGRAYIYATEDGIKVKSTVYVTE
ncbi:MAG: Ig domain-containing protein [Anaerocolumna sp.]